MMSLEKKIVEKDLNVCFEDYKDGKKYEPAMKFIQKKYMSANQNKKRSITGFPTTATDTKIVTNVWKTVFSILVKDFMKKENLL